MNEKKRPRPDKEFEKRIAETCLFYEQEKLLTLRKADPPTRIIGPGKMIYLPNPWLDFAGSWNERAGRAVFIEAKLTSEPKLRIGCSGGLSETQIESLTRWDASNAVAGILWRDTSNGVRTWLMPWAWLQRVTLAVDVRHIKSDEVHPGCRVLELDFLATMRGLWPQYAT